MVKMGMLKQLTMNGFTKSMNSDVLILSFKINLTTSKPEEVRIELAIASSKSPGKIRTSYNDIVVHNYFP